MSVIQKGLDRLAYQFKTSAKFREFITAFLKGLEDLETTGEQLLTERYLETAIGVQLDGIGEIVGLRRPSKSINLAGLFGFSDTPTPNFPEDTEILQYLDFGANSGDIAFDHSSYSNDGALTGHTWVPGVVGSGISFDGTTGKADCGNGAPLNNLGNNDDFWVSAWLKDSTGAPNAYSGILIKYQDGNNHILVVSRNTNQDLKIIVKKAGAIIVDETFYNATIFDGDLHHVVVAFSQSSRQIGVYVDSHLLSKTVYYEGGDWSNTGNVIWGNGMHGMLDECRIIRGKPTQENVAALYDHPEWVSVPSIGEDSTALGLSDLYNPSVGGNLWDGVGGEILINDDSYRKLLKAKIIENQTSMTVDDTLRLISYTFDDVKVRYILSSTLRPRYDIGKFLTIFEQSLLSNLPVLIGIDSVDYHQMWTIGESFAFVGDDDGLGLGDLFNPDAGGHLASLIL